MPSTLHPFDEPVDPGLYCRNCTDPIVATAQVFDGGLRIGGLNEYRWTHAHGSDVCRPTTRAQPFDGWQATTKVKAVLAARDAAEDALIDALEGKKA
jgi:ABC-type xylose transport system substrate-binding protein